MTSGVVHQDPQDGICSQAPPLALIATASNATAASVLTTVMYCGSGLPPPDGFMKFRGLSWRKALSATTTLTGIVTLLPAAVKASWPVKVPATNPCPGNAVGTMAAVKVVGAVPVLADNFSQAAPSEVVTPALQVNVPAPPLRIWKDWEGGVPPPVWNEKLIAPGIESKNGFVVAAMVRVTGTAIDRFPEPCTVMMTSAL